MVLTTIGLWLRFLAPYYTFVYAIIGQTIMAIGQPFMYNAPPKISATWFEEDQRIMATSIGAYANVVGVAFGCFVPAFYMHDEDTVDEAKHNLADMSFMLAVASTIICVLSLLFIKDNKQAAIQQSEEEQVSLKQTMVILLKNSSFIKVALSHSLAMTFFFSFVTVLEQMISVYGFTSTQASYLSTALQIAGLLGGAIYSIILTKLGSGTFKATSLVIIGGTFITLILFHFLLQTRNYYLLLTATCLNGFFSLSQFSVAYEMSIHVSREINNMPYQEITSFSNSIEDAKKKPVLGEATISGIINLLANLCAFIAVLILTPILDRGLEIDVSITDAIFAVILLISIVLMMLYK
ncbi:hypothetical protein FGO68_gene10913 [Halteria grandinella]|uniref:Major facilitator superfamily (MFS) profile domain-containing protein n=1 Tax=Halteria grandinella TaxID=5974 RepID=A0A8J8NPZ9_HALGN|nr:hypothetical protein FGO68_gene10913 [Halteria grandinella]